MIHRGLREFAADLSLRIKFLLSLVLIITVMTCGTLLTVRQFVKAHAERQVEEDVRNSLLTFQVMAQQRRLILDRKADLLATLALLRDGDSTTIEDVSQDPWQSEDCDLFALADAKGKITALQTRMPELPAALANEAIESLLRSSSRQDWWVSGGEVYQVVVRPYYQDPPVNHVLLGEVIVGRGIDSIRAAELGRILSSQVMFRYGADTVVSSFQPVDEKEISDGLKRGVVPDRVQLGRKQFFTRSAELTPGAHPSLSLTVLKSDDEELASVAMLNRMLLGLGLFAVLGGGALVYMISDTFTRPLGSLVEGVHALEQGDFTYPLAAIGRDEVARVTRAFESMRSTLERNETQRQQLEGQLRQSQKMDALGRLAGGVAHDFNNLLTVIKGNSDLVLDRIQPTDPIHRSCEQIRKVADRAASLTRQLLAFSRRQVLEPKILDLNELIIDTGKLLKRLLREDIEYKVQLGESLGRVQADPGQIEQVLLNLTVNASDAMANGGTLTIETQNLRVDERYAQAYPPLEPGDYVMLAVSDSGHGMDADTKARIFEPFFTTKEPGKGTGLGLATVYGVVKQSSGYVRVDSAPGQGARFEIYLPRTREEAPTALVQDRLAAPQGARETVLLAEDEDDVRKLAAEFLKSAGYQVLTAADGAEALALGERLGKTIRVLVTDVVMPRMRGPELAKRLKDLFPGLKVIYISGYLEEFGGAPKALEGESFLHKPFSRYALLRQIDDALRGKPARQADPVEVLCQAP